ncbi:MULTISPECIES: hypothetical protein [Bacillus]|uniref:Uncharacterized protein n=1 Tax=Bacillus pseudomycoides TaxID=64104 RepID=A0A1Y3M8W8_9BACI|nr:MULTISPECIES: hypothetical protein [Bacillus cereus group]EOP67695.1 hypothetical protein KOW_04088 [Bacillus cereus VDM006]EOQ04057.1 hypothetical protein KOY_00736 [Bacillus cereus VDM021]OOG90143.1 hypothetical protein BTH41_03854 [Bacillus mycoides]MDF2085163.1 hypothetical protein [Bacillus pseudomycoides]OUM46174.1 hypothetical protein BW425_25165 [Bacillus pseudomycoides]
MKHNINLWSFICSLICIGLFRLYFEIPSEIFKFFTDSLHIHPLFILLVLTIGTFFAGMIDFSKINNWVAMLRSIVTVLLTFSLSVFLTLTLIVGYALS